MRVVAKVFAVDADKKYRVVLNNIYGGCRAAGWRAGWVVFEKTNRDYEVQLNEIKVDRIHDDPIDGFQFPKPPSRKFIEPLGLQELDLKGCIKLAGQSRWIFFDESRMIDAIDRDADKTSCESHLRALTIDFTQWTLVGWSFASGHCGRPVGLELSAIQETSTDTRENRYIIDARYDAAGENACKVWTTYPVWLLVPRSAPGYRFDFEDGLRPKK